MQGLTAVYACSADQQQYQEAAHMLRLRLAIQVANESCLDFDIAEDLCELISCIGQEVSAS